MPWIAYRAITPQGGETSGKIEAESISDAIKTLRQEGLTPYETQLATGLEEKWWNKDILERAGLKSSELELFARELSTFINAQLPLDEALYSISASLNKSQLEEKTTLLREEIQQGQSLSDALAKHSIFPRVTKV